MDDESPHSTPFTTAAEYSAALDSLCASVKRTLYIFEQDFFNIGFNSNERYETLRAYLLAGPYSELHMLAHETRHISQHCPRMMNLLRQFGHNMKIYQTPKHLKHLAEAFAVADDTNYVRRFHIDSTRGIAGFNDPATARNLRSRFAEMWQASQPSPHTTSFIL